MEKALRETDIRNGHEGWSERAVVEVWYRRYEGSNLVFGEGERTSIDWFA